jgi:hypothetical protein
VFADQESPLLDKLQAEMEAGTADDAIDSAQRLSKRHFEHKNASLPSTTIRRPARFTAVDADYLRSSKR